MKHLKKQQIRINRKHNSSIAHASILFDSVHGSNMELMTSDLLQNTFMCELCGLSTPYTYYGQKPPNTRAIV